MGLVDDSPSALPYVAFPLAALITVAAIVRMVRSTAQEKAWFKTLTRAPGDASPGPALLLVEVSGAQAVNLGYSTESKGPSGSPTLKGEGVTLAIVGGPPITIAEGATIEVRTLAGARCKLVDTTTTDAGVQNRYTFEVPSGTRFWIRGVVEPSTSPSAEAAPPYRDSRLPARLLPLDGKYVIDQKQEGPRRPARSALGSALVTAFLATQFGMMPVMCWRTGCQTGRFSIPGTAWLDALSIGAVMAALVAYLVAGSNVPQTYRK